MSRLFSKEEEALVRKAVKRRPVKESAFIVSAAVGREITEAQLRSWMRNHHCPSGYVPRGGNNRLFPAEEEKKVRSVVKGRSALEAARVLSGMYGKSVTEAQVKAWRKNHHCPSGTDGRFPKGWVPYSAGKRPQDLCHGKAKLAKLEASWYQKGHVAPNHLPVGSVVTNKEGYKLIKVREKGTQWERWQFLHRKVWEDAHGKLPEGAMITMLDGDKGNCSLSNLRLITKGVNSQLTNRHLRDGAEETAESRLALARLYDGISRRSKKKEEES